MTVGVEPLCLQNHFDDIITVYFESEKFEELPEGAFTPLFDFEVRFL